MSDLGAHLRAAREAAGYSLARIAALTHFSKPYLGLVETGHRAVTADILDRYEQALGVSIGTALEPVRVTHEWLISDSPAVCHLKAGHKVGRALVSHLEGRMIELRHLDDTVSSSHLLPVIAKELSEAETVAAQATYTDELGVRLLTVIGELAQLAGWVASDAGHYPKAQQHYLSGVEAAERAGDKTLGAQLLSCLAYQIANIGKREDALLIARSAVKGATAATPVVRALLLERFAWAAARIKDADTTRHALDAVDDAYEQRSADICEPEWVYWLDRGEIDVMAGRCLIELGKPANAEPLLNRALAAYNSSHLRETGLYQTWLAEGYARAGDLDAAKATLDHARAIADRVESARLQRRITAIGHLISKRAGNTANR
ncbi:MAG TPA: helix-turn-helix domain-containing protein [Candidatus Limnocylindrales bacterium]|nr:helix-turn-helix domain-containing protein [Candidatus Limnocylindrales bacterium]